MDRVYVGYYSTHPHIRSLKKSPYPSLYPHEHQRFISVSYRYLSTHTHTRLPTILIKIIDNYKLSCKFKFLITLKKFKDVIVELRNKQTFI